MNDLVAVDDHNSRWARGVRGRGLVRHVHQFAGVGILLGPGGLAAAATGTDANPAAAVQQADLATPVDDELTEGPTVEANEGSEDEGEAGNEANEGSESDETEGPETSPNYTCTRPGPVVVVIAQRTVDALLFFGATGVTLNHPSWTFGLDGSQQTVTDDTADATEGSMSFKGPGYAADLFFGMSTGAYDLTVDQAGARRGHE